ncbi:acyltransferase family protein [Hydrogenophaga sp.]|uniref:acyltransferase family protein n=1 Tax=Hydrogenophaga sp. TaxID=1904254 RepID=UPI00356A87C0
MKVGNIRGITGLRGLAAWLVVFYHFREPFAWAGDTWIMKVVGQGFLAVDLFFVLSGLVIYLNYHTDFQQLRPVNMLLFYGKRLARIYPLHITILLMYLLNPLAIVFASSSATLDGRYDPAYFLMSIFLVQNWGFTDELAWNIPAWSISTEFAAYLLFPLLVFGLKRVAQAGWAWLWFVFALCLLGLPGLYLSMDSPSLGANISHLGVYRCVIEFTMGLVLGYWYIRYRHSSVAISRYAMLGLLAWGLLAVATGQLADYWVAPLAFSLLIAVFFDGGSLLSKAFGGRIPNYLGEISYSTYLVHYFVKDWVKFLSPELGVGSFVVYVALVFALSAILYKQVETRFRLGLYRRLSVFKAQG